MIIARIFPYMNFTVDSVRKKLCKKFNNGRRKFLIMITSAPGNEGVMKGSIATEINPIIFLHWNLVCSNPEIVHVSNEICNSECHK